MDGNRVIKNALLQQLNRPRVENHRATSAPEAENTTAQLDEARNLGWHLLPAQKWVQLGRPAQRLAALFHGVLVLQAVALRRSARLYSGCAP